MALMVGRGAGDGTAKSAGWVAIVEATNKRPQPTWTEARDARGLSGEQALSSAAAKFVLWHLSQPTAYLLLLFAYHCFVAELGKEQQFLATVVAAREVLYICNLTFAAYTLPVFLLLDLKTVWAESTALQRFVRLAMYTLTPHNYVALCCAARFPAWRRVFIGLGGPGHRGHVILLRAGCPAREHHRADRGDAKRRSTQGRLRYHGVRVSVLLRAAVRRDQC